MIAGGVVAVGAAAMTHGGKLHVGPGGATLTAFAPAPHHPPGSEAAPAAAQVSRADGSIPISSLPPEFRGDGSPGGALQAMNEAARMVRDVHGSVECSVALLDCTVGRKGAEINMFGVEQQDFACRNNVRSLGMCLAVLDRYDGPLEGNAGSLLRAVLKFQRDRGLRPDGIVGGKTWTLLRSEVLRALRSSSVPNRARLEDPDHTAAEKLDPLGGG